MEIAYRLLNQWDWITSHADFLLGSVAPDSVHMRPEYRVEDKIHSHLFEGCGIWGDTDDYERWIRNIQLFKKQYIEEETDNNKKSFMMGIYVHCMTDYCNDIMLWRKIQKKYIPPLKLEQFREIYYPEARGIDQWLYQHSENTVKICNLLAEGRAYKVGDLLNIEDIELQRKHLLYKQYETEAVDISQYRFLADKIIEEIINKTVEKIDHTWNII